jgi:hypothetical protein
MSDDVTRERAWTPGMKRRGVVKVLKSALHDAQRDVGTSRVVGIFGVILYENDTANLLSAVTRDEMRTLLIALPEAFQRVVQEFKLAPPEPTQ